ncbi:MAG TPA: TonB-dependent receptor, partial [Porticoccus sp.]|nr:TonB-dependent receptor [Porticoccus sp.]
MRVKPRVNDEVRMLKYINVHLSVLLAAYSSLTIAASDSTDIMINLRQMSLEELMKVEITSSTLSAESLKSVPSSVTIFTRKQIQQLGINTLEELMNHVPGYQNYVSDTNQSSYSSRSRRVASGSREVLVLLDGQRLNNDLFGNAGAIQPLSLKNVAKVEFIRGPGSAIYGANAFLGVINVMTVNDISEVDVSTGSFQQRQISLNVNTEAGAFNSNLTIESQSGDGELLSRYDPITANFIDSHQETSQKSIYWRARWNDGSDGGLSLQARHLENISDGGYFSGRASDAYNRFDFGSSFFALQYKKTLNENWEFSSRISDSLYEYQAEFLAAKTPSEVEVIGRINMEGNDRSFENQLRWHQGSAKAMLGMDYTRNSVDRVESSAQFLPAPPNPSSNAFGTDVRQVRSWYGQWQDELRQNWTYILGIRRDDYSDIKGHTSPRAGLIWGVDESNTLKLLYGEAFRAPARNETSATNPSQLGNPNLQPEISKTLEFVWMKTGEHYYGTVSLFDTKIT